MQEFTLNKPTRVLWLLFPIVIFLGAWHSYQSEDTPKLLFFLIGIPLSIVINIVVWSYKTILNEKGIASLHWVNKRKTYSWDQIYEIKDDSFLVWHFYWLLPAKQEKESSGRNCLILTNLGIANYALLLANIVRHVNPNTAVSPSILRHLNLTRDDIGKQYKSNQWTSVIKATSYWTEKHR